MGLEKPTVFWNQKVYYKYGYSEKYRNHMN